MHHHHAASRVRHLIPFTALALLLAGGCMSAGDGRSADEQIVTTAHQIASANGGVAWASIDGRAAPVIMHAHNSSGDPITATRSAPGVYAVTFAGQGHDLASNQGNVQVVAIGDDAVRCSVGAMTRGGAPGPRRTITATIRCWQPTATGALPADSPFVVLYVQDRAGGVVSSRGYAQVEGGNLVAARTFAPTAAPVEIIPYEDVPGSYYLAFGGTWPRGGVTPIVSAYGTTNTLECHTTDFFPETGELFVGCFDQDGPADGDFSVVLFDTPPAPASWIPDTFHYAPDPEHPFPTTGYPRFFAQESGPVGGYVLQYRFGTYPYGVLPVVSALGPNARYCKIASYVPTTPAYPVSDFNLAQLIMRCFDTTGTPAPSDLAAAFVISGPVVIY
jgi:hypothetical protein